MVELGGANEQKPLVTITGISGYIGAETTLQYLQDGGFRVRGTVRDKTNESKIAPLREAFGELFNQLELVEADLLNEESLVSAIAGSTYVVHVASPFFFTDDESSVVPGAVNGTLAVMKGCKAAGVRRCVVTTSCLAGIMMDDANRPTDLVYNESHWSSPDREGGIGAYPKSKFLAEKAAWDFIAQLPEAEKFELVTIGPSFTMGPPLRKESCVSVDFMKGILGGAFPQLPDELRVMCDVRDVARAHLLAIKNPIAANRRFFICTNQKSYKQFGRDFRALGWPISEEFENELPDGPPYPTVDTSAAVELGIEFTPLLKTLTDMTNKMIELGVVTKPATSQ